MKCDLHSHEYVSPLFILSRHSDGCHCLSGMLCISGGNVFEEDTETVGEEGDPGAIAE